MRVGCGTRFRQFCPPSTYRKQFGTEPSGRTFGSEKQFACVVVSQSVLVLKKGMVRFPTVSLISEQVELMTGEEAGAITEDSSVAVQPGSVTAASMMRMAHEILTNAYRQNLDHS